MKIYVLKVKIDCDSFYLGLDDIKVKCFTTLEKADQEMKKVYEEFKASFIEEGCAEDKLDNDYYFTNKKFMVSNGKDYYSGEILESELK